jgi:MraZ protein
VVSRFLGRFEHSLDTKGRVVLPAKFRVSFATNLFITQHSEGCLALWTPEAFEEEVANKESQAVRSGADRNAVRVWASNSAEVEIDRSGRVAIPSWLRTYAGLEDGGEVLVMGALDRIELWSRSTWETRVQPAEATISNPVDPPTPAPQA